jgi:hypothetical protein
VNQITVAVFGTENNVNRFAHGVVLAFFWAGCGLVWLLLKLPPMVRLKGVGLVDLPQFTRLCMGVIPAIIIGMATLATAYCLLVWLGKLGNRNSWVGFLSSATAALLFMLLPTIIAVILPLIDALHKLPTSQ